jgi:hypothetical protein
MTMDIDAKRMWVAALRSGKYQQGTGVLRNKDEKYCCLGVFCDLIDDGEWVSRKSFDVYFYNVGHNIVDLTLAESILIKYNIPHEQIDKLIEMNDTERSFIEIADWIEHNL